MSPNTAKALSYATVAKELWRRTDSPYHLGALCVSWRLGGLILVFVRHRFTVVVFVVTSTVCYHFRSTNSENFYIQE